MARRWHGKGSGGVVGKKGRRGWGRIRQLPSSGRYQANYVGPDRVRHNALTTFETKMDAEAWLAAERRSIERDEWQPPSLRVAEKKAKGVAVVEYAHTWIEQRNVKPRTRSTATLTRADGLTRCSDSSAASFLAWLRAASCGADTI